MTAERCGAKPPPDAFDRWGVPFDARCALPADHDGPHETRSWTPRDPVVRARENLRSFAWRDHGSDSRAAQRRSNLGGADA